MIGRHDGQPGSGVYFGEGLEHVAFLGGRTLTRRALDLRRAARRGHVSRRSTQTSSAMLTNIQRNSSLEHESGAAD